MSTRDSHGIIISRTGFKITAVVSGEISIYHCMEHSVIVARIIIYNWASRKIYLFL